MRHFIHLLTNLGVSEDLSPIDERRVRFLNSLALFCGVISVVYVLINLFSGLPRQALFSSPGFFLVIPVFLLNHKGKIQTSALYFIISISILIAVASYNSYLQGRNNDSENLIYAFIAGNSLLVNGSWRRFLVFAFLLILLIFMNGVQLSVAGTSLGKSFYLTCINITILAISLSVFVGLFRSVLVDAVSKSEKQQEVLFSLIDNVPNYLALIDLDRRYLMVNKRYVDTFEKDRREILGKDSSLILSSEIFEQYTEFFERAKSGESIEFSDQVTLPNGKVIDAWGKYTPVKNKNGSIVAISIYVADISNLKEVEKELELANKSKERLFSIISHDLRSPLNLFEGVINLDSKVLKRDEFDNYQRLVREKLHNVKITLENLLSWSKSQLNQIKPKPDSINLHDTIMNQVNLYDVLINSKSIDVVVDVSNDQMVFIDPDHLSLILRNLFHNALKFTPQDGSVHFSLVDGKKDHVVLTLKDSGVGIDADLLNSIQKGILPESTSGTEGEMGTGLGLSLVSSLLKRNNSTIQIDTKKGKGTTFQIEMPTVREVVTQGQA